MDVFDGECAMAKPSSPSKHLIGNRVATAKSTTEKVQEDIQVAEEKLHRASEIITDKLQDGTTKAELAEAASHTEEVEEKLREANQNLKVVTELLSSEERDRQRLEQAAREADGTSSPGSRSGEGSSSVIEHLRELTRHKLNSDHA